MHSDVVREGVAGGMVDAAEEVIRQGHVPTLRDRFAMAALQGMMCHADRFGGEDTDGARLMAIESYRFADAMLEARKPTAVQP